MFGRIHGGGVSCLRLEFPAPLKAIWQVRHEWEVVVFAGGSWISDCWWVAKAEDGWGLIDFSVWVGIVSEPAFGAGWFWLGSFGFHFLEAFDGAAAL